MKKGSIISKGSPSGLLKIMESNVFEVYVKDEEFRKLQEQYVISNLKNSADGLIARIIADEPPTQYDYIEISASLEDLYLHYFMEK